MQVGDIWATAWVLAWVLHLRGGTRNLGTKGLSCLLQDSQWQKNVMIPGSPVLECLSVGFVPYQSMTAARPFTTPIVSIFRALLNTQAWQ
jgi:hypothetical protein